MKYHLHKAKLSLSIRGKWLNSLTLLLNVFGIILGQFIHNYILCLYSVRKGFPGSLAGKESSCSAGDPGSIPGSGRSAGEGIGYPLHYSSASLVAQTVKNLPTMQETWVKSLGFEDPLEEGMATHSSILAWRIPMDRAWHASPWSGKELDMTKWLSTA